jgi:methyl-accepting chemotaxis protein
MNSLKNLSVGLKVALAPAVGVLCLCLLGAVAWFANAQLGRALDVLTQETIPRQNKIAALKLSSIELSARINQSLAWEGAGVKEAKIKVLDAAVVKEANALTAEFQAFSADKSLDSTEQKILADLVAEYAKINTTFNEAFRVKAEGLATATTYMNTLETSFSKMNELFGELGKRTEEQAGAMVLSAHSVASSNSIAIITVLLVAGIVCSAFAWIAVQLIVAPLQDAMRLAQTMARGDFTEQAQAGNNDATGQMLNAMNEVSSNLGSIVRDIRNSASEVDSASQEIAQGNADLSARTESTAASLEQTSAALKELNEQVRDSAAYAQQANQLARQASAVADEGGSVVLEAVSVMEKINAQAKKISEIIGVIDGIAFQTNILALNAAVEAARAGEQGRGFAVVAQEVRTLAQRSSEAAKEIRALIGASVDQAEIGAEKVQAAGSTMQRVVSAIRSVGQSVDEISRSSSSQAHGFAQVEAAVSEMDTHTQQNAALVEEASAAAMSLKVQAQKLLEAVDTLKTRG